VLTERHAVARLVLGMTLGLVHLLLILLADARDAIDLQLRLVQLRHQTRVLALALADGARVLADEHGERLHLQAHLVVAELHLLGALVRQLLRPLHTLHLASRLIQLRLFNREFVKILAIK